MRALQLEKLPAWRMEDLNIGWKIDQPEMLKLSKSSPRPSDSSVINLADSRGLNPFDKPIISRLSKDGWSDISDLANCVEGQSSRPSQDLEERVTMKISNCSLNACASDLESWKTNELFPPNWKNAKNQIVRVHPEESIEDLHMVDVPKIKLELTVPYVKNGMSSPIDLFDLDKVFDKVESMHSDSRCSESPSRELCSNISETSDSQYSHYMGRVAELEALLSKMWDSVETLTAKNKKLQEDKIRIEVDAAATAEDFQKTIDQLVAEVVRLENESEEKRILLAYMWEESQVAQVASKDRRVMLACMRKENTGLLVKLERLQMLYDKMLKTNTMDLKKENTIDLMTTVTNFVEVIPCSPIIGKKVGKMSYREWEQFPSSSEILKEDKLILKPESDVNEYRLSKFAEMGFGEDTLFKVTIEEISPATISIVTSFKITNHDGEISDLITKFRKIGLRWPKGKSNENEWNSSQKSEVDGFGEEVEVQSSKLHIPTLISSESDQCDNGHRRSRSWSAPPNRSVCISLLQSLWRLSSPLSLKVHEQRQSRLTHKIKNDAIDVIRRPLSSQNPPNDIYISDEEISTYFPVSKICDVTKTSCHTIQLNANKPHDSEEVFNLWGGIEQNHTIAHPSLDHLQCNRRASSEWTEKSDRSRALNIWECHNSCCKVEIRLSVHPQSCISIASRDWKMREIKRHFKVRKRRKKKSKKKASVGIFDFEIRRRSPSLKFI